MYVPSKPPDLVAIQPAHKWLPRNPNPIPKSRQRCLLESALVLDSSYAHNKE